MPFTKKRIEDAGGDWKNASETNASLAEIKRQRIGVLQVSGDLQRSKIAWKVAVFRQALTYRMADLADASISEWMRGNTLSSIVLARALMETAALTHYYTSSFATALDNGDLGELDRLAMQGSFGGKHPYWRLEGTEAAVNVMKALDHLSKEIPGARDFYERISEIAHPNAQGVHQFYTKTNKSNGQVNFSRNTRGRRETLAHLLAALVSLEWAAAKLLALDELIPAIADLHQLLVSNIDPA